MSLQQWSDDIVVVDLASEPDFSEEMASLNDALDNVPVNVVLNLDQVEYLNSSNIAQMLRLRKRVAEADLHLRLCCVPDSVWGVMLTTGLDSLFDVAEDTPSALASLQLDE